MQPPAMQPFAMPIVATPEHTQRLAALAARIEMCQLRRALLERDEADATAEVAALMARYGIPPSPVVALETEPGRALPAGTFFNRATGQPLVQTVAPAPAPDEGTAAVGGPVGAAP